MTEPVLIIHGINNHDSSGFKEDVEKLQRVIGPDKRLIPVYWGQLGGQSTDIADCLPAFTDGQWHVRSEEAAVPSLTPDVVRSLLGRSTSLDNAQRADLVTDQVQSESLVRSTPGADQQQVRAAVASELGQTRVLQYLDDRETLRIVGRAIDAVLRDLPAGGSTAPDVQPTGEFTVGGGYTVRSEVTGVSATDTRALFDPIKRITSHVMQGIDEALGRFVGNQIGKLNQNVRERLAVPISTTLGDIMTYQRQPDRVQETLRKALADNAPGCGTKERPIHVIAHSLGGVIAFDAAMNPVSEDERLWIKSFVTFGSQAAFFHIVDPRTPELKEYRSDAPVKLHPSIGRWTNLWNPMDLLAFTAGTVFRMSDGGTPEDICVEATGSELVSEKAWTHSIYWESGELAAALRSALN